MVKSNGVEMSTDIRKLVVARMSSPCAYEDFDKDAGWRDWARGGLRVMGNVGGSIGGGIAGTAASAATGGTLAIPMAIGGGAAGGLAGDAVGTRLGNWLFGPEEQEQTPTQPQPQPQTPAPTPGMPTTSLAPKTAGARTMTNLDRMAASAAFDRLGIVLPEGMDKEAWINMALQGARLANTGVGRGVGKALQWGGQQLGKLWAGGGKAVANAGKGVLRTGGQRAAQMNSLKDANLQQYNALVAKGYPAENAMQMVRDSTSHISKMSPSQVRGPTGVVGGTRSMANEAATKLQDNLTSAGAGTGKAPSAVINTMVQARGNAAPPPGFLGRHGNTLLTGGMVASMLPAMIPMGGGGGEAPPPSPEFGAIRDAYKGTGFGKVSGVIDQLAYEHAMRKVAKSNSEETSFHDSVSRGRQVGSDVGAGAGALAGILEGGRRASLGRRAGSALVGGLGGSVVGHAVGAGVGGLAHVLRSKKREKTSASKDTPSDRTGSAISTVGGAAIGRYAGRGAGGLAGFAAGHAARLGSGKALASQRIGEAVGKVGGTIAGGIAGYRHHSGQRAADTKVSEKKSCDIGLAGLASLTKSADEAPSDRTGSYLNMLGGANLGGVAGGVAGAGAGGLTGLAMRRLGVLPGMAVGSGLGSLAGIGVGAVGGYKNHARRREADLAGGAQKPENLGATMSTMGGGGLGYGVGSVAGGMAGSSLAGILKRGPEAVARGSSLGGMLGGLAGGAYGAIAGYRRHAAQREADRARAAGIKTSSHDQVPSDRTGSVLSTLGGAGVGSLVGQVGGGVLGGLAGHALGRTPEDTAAGVGAGSVVGSLAGLGYGGYKGYQHHKKQREKDRGEREEKEKGKDIIKKSSAGLGVAGSGFFPGELVKSAAGNNARAYKAQQRAKQLAKKTPAPPQSKIPMATTAASTPVKHPVAERVFDGEPLTAAVTQPASLGSSTAKRAVPKPPKPPRPQPASEVKTPPPAASPPPSQGSYLNRGDLAGAAVGLSGMAGLAGLVGYHANRQGETSLGGPGSPPMTSPTYAQPQFNTIGPTLSSPMPNLGVSSMGFPGMTRFASAGHRDKVAFLDELKAHWQGLAPEHKIMTGLGGAAALGSLANGIRQGESGTGNTLLGLGGLAAGAYGLSGGKPLEALQGIAGGLGKAFGRGHTPVPAESGQAGLASLAKDPKLSKYFDGGGNVNMMSVVKAPDDELRAGLAGISPKHRAELSAQISGFKPGFTHRIGAKAMGIDIDGQKERLGKLLNS